MDITFAIDVSHHQPKSLDLAQTRRDGCELAILKAGEGDSFVDPDFASNLAEARAAGQLVAAYWYQRSSASSAAHVSKIKQVVPRDVAVIPDVEANSGGVNLTRAIVNGLISEGYRVPWTYLPKWYWQQIGSPSLAGLPPLWSSRYPDNVVGLLSSEWAQVPASYWVGYGGLDVGLLQFTSSARIAGYAPLDASAFRGTRDQLAAVLGQDNNNPGGGSSPGPTTTTGVELMERVTITASKDTKSTRLKLPGGPNCKLIVRPANEGDDNNPVWIQNVYAWASSPTRGAKVGIGYNPMETPGYDFKIVYSREVVLPNAVWCDFEASSNNDFTVDIVG